MALSETSILLLGIFGGLIMLAIVIVVILAATGQFNAAKKIIETELPSETEIIVPSAVLTPTFPFTFTCFQPNSQFVQSGGSIPNGGPASMSGDGSTFMTSSSSSTGGTNGSLQLVKAALDGMGDFVIPSVDPVEVPDSPLGSGVSYIPAATALTTDGSELFWVQARDDNSNLLVKRWDITSHPATQTYSISIIASGANNGLFISKQVQYDTGNPTTHVLIGSTQVSDGIVLTVDTGAIDETIAASSIAALTGKTEFGRNLVQMENILCVSMVNNSTDNWVSVYVLRRTNAASLWTTETPFLFDVPEHLSGWSNLRVNAGQTAMKLSKPDGLQLFLSCPGATSPDGKLNAGAVIIFTRESVSTSEFTVLGLVTAKTPTAEENFGLSLDYSEDSKFLIVGSNDAVYAYVTTANTFILEERQPLNVTPNDVGAFPVSVADSLNNGFYHMVFARGNITSSSSSTVSYSLCDPV